MILKLELTEDEYVFAQASLMVAANNQPLTKRGRLELLHLQALLAEASVKEEQ